MPALLIESDRWTNNGGKTMTSISIKSIIGILIMVVIALAILPTIVTSTAAAAACLSGAAKVMVELIPLFYVIAIVLSLVTWATTIAGKK